MRFIIISISVLYLSACASPQQRTSSHYIKDPVISPGEQKAWYSSELLSKYAENKITKSDINVATSKQFNLCKIEQSKIPTATPSCTQPPARDCSGLTAVAYGICMGGGSSQPVCNYLAYDASIKAQHNAFVSCMNEKDFYYTTFNEAQKFIHKIGEQVKNEKLSKIPPLNNNEYLGGYGNSSYYTLLKENLFINDTSIYFNIKKYNDDFDIGGSVSRIDARLQYDCASLKLNEIDSSIYYYISEETKNKDSDGITKLVLSGFKKYVPDNIVKTIANMCSDLKNPNILEKLSYLHDFTVKDGLDDKDITSSLRLFCNDNYSDATDNACSTLIKKSDRVE